jgi:hypothetical protein
VNVRVYRDERTRLPDDGYRCELVPGLRSSQDARTLLDELAFATARIKVLGSAPTGAYEQARALALKGDFERGAWLCFLIAYLCPLEDERPFASIERAFSLGTLDDAADELIEELPLGPRSSHRPGRGAATLRAYRAFTERTGSARQALSGDPSWRPERRFGRIFERLAIEGFSRAGRYELLLILGSLALCPMRADSLQLVAASALRSGREHGGGEQVLEAAKRVFGIGETVLLERRAKQLAQEIGIPVEALDLALFNWHSSRRATLGHPAELRDAETLARGESALSL